MTLPAAVSLWDTNDTNTDVPDASQISDGYALTAYPTAGVLNELFKGYSKHCAYIQTLQSEALTWTNVQAITVNSASPCLTGTNNGTGNGLRGISTSGVGVYGTGSTKGVEGNSTATAIYGSGGTLGVQASGSIYGAYIQSTAGWGIWATGIIYGIETSASTGTGVKASGTTFGIQATATAGCGVKATGTSTGIWGVCSTGSAVYGEGTTSGGGGYFTSGTGTAVTGSTTDGIGGAFSSVNGCPISISVRNSAPTATDGGMYISTSPSLRLYVYVSGAWHYVNLT